MASLPISGCRLSKKESKARRMSPISGKKPRCKAQAQLYGDQAFEGDVVVANDSGPGNTSPLGHCPFY